MTDLNNEDVVDVVEGDYTWGYPKVFAALVNGLTCTTFEALVAVTKANLGLLAEYVDVQCLIQDDVWCRMIGLVAYGHGKCNGSEYDVTVVNYAAARDWPRSYWSCEGRAKFASDLALKYALKKVPNE